MEQPAHADDGSADHQEPTPTLQRSSPIVRVFRNRFGHWRAGWRLVVYAVTAFVVGKAVGLPFKLLFPNAPNADFLSWPHTLVYVVGDLALILGGLIVLRFFDRRPAALLGLGFGRRWLAEFAGGLAAGLLATTLLVVILVVGGSVSLTLSPDPGASLGAFFFFFVLFALAATIEELLFRGYPLQALAEGSRRWIAAALLCIPFTMAHADNPDATVIGIANIFLASVVLVVLYFQTRRLWLPIGFHLSWNLCQSWLWGFDVSGITIRNQLFVVTPTGSDLLTGGGFGLEGSVLLTILFVVIVVWLLLRPVLRPTDEVAAAWARYPAGFGLDPAQAPDGVTSTPEALASDLDGADESLSDVGLSVSSDAGGIPGVES